MHGNDGTLAENWIIERGGWQLDRVNKAFGYMLDTTQADQKVSRVLSGWKPKDGARLPTLAALDTPILAHACELQQLLVSSTMAFADADLNLDDDVAHVLTATLFIHYPDMLVLCPSSPHITKIRELLAERAIGESELLVWSVAISLAFATPPASEASGSGGEEPSPVLIDLIKRQSKQIDTALYENRHIAGYLMLFLPEGFALDTSSPAYKSEVLELGDQAQQNALTFLKSHGPSTVAAGSALKALRQMQKVGKLDTLIAQFHERVDQALGGHHPRETSQLTVSPQPHSLVLLMLDSAAITPPQGHHTARGQAAVHDASRMLFAIPVSRDITPPEAEHPSPAGLEDPHLPEAKHPSVSLPPAVLSGSKLNE
ncbi:hypothetical protein PHYSODRAFT_331382 [Phytophthora sojae]|uniref:Uncharacterized protein n=1 Tax=Phytophthora sojae (strain P6497) TaxID=1094619 RepID=G4ZE51_PHYSP|nr:hypothetical protein PHYSODRAFT_331382 [Phytophthora sojae]EGZ17402.1 hypothetical protein PHYSODRAFT_331382 [Phytophthora sojae]|eukprot:XP_009526460.1 hypothetical protein PHYSODRAFT_331382 [Phytophthora sojae]